jgi:hypothetical protein
MGSSNVTVVEMEVGGRTRQLRDLRQEKMT